jgi:membrane protease YdiL (CAAX protease family)
VCAFAGQIVIAVAVLIAHIPYTNNTSGRGFDRLVDRRLLYTTFAIVAVVVAPFVEELVFRGLVLRALRSRMPLVPAVFIQGVLFGSAHIQLAYGWRNIGLVMVLSWIGIAFGFVAAWMRRIGPTIIAHALMNGFVLIVMLARR